MQRNQKVKLHEEIRRNLAIIRRSTPPFCETGDVSRNIATEVLNIPIAKDHER